MKVDFLPAPIVQKYPCLMRDKTHGQVVLFTDEGVGTVVVPCNIYSLGFHTGGWIMQHFEKVPCTVTLTEE